MLTLEFNMLPVSINKLYVNIPGQKRRFLSTEGRKFKETIEKEILDKFKENKQHYHTIVSSMVGKKLAVDIKMYSPSWVLKDGVSIRKKDLISGEKALTDSIFNALNELDVNIILDDSQIWSENLSKIITADYDKTVFTITVLES